jgi:hypothetical protein
MGDRRAGGPVAATFAATWIIAMLPAFTACPGANGGACETTELLAADGAAGDYLGASVCLRGDVAVVGAYFDDDNGIDSGSACVFRWNGSTWEQEDKLVAPDGSVGDCFGWAVSVSGTVAVAGSPHDDDNGIDSGSAYVFRWNGSTWEEEAKLVASDGGAGDEFGYAVALVADAVVVGACFDDGVGADVGSAYVYRQNGSSWDEEAKLVASEPDPGDEFGCSVSLSGDVAVVGSHHDGADSVDCGSAYVFRRNGDSWIEETRLLASDGATADDFGCAVSVDGNVAVVGAVGDTDVVIRAGSAYVYRWSGASWLEEAKLLASDGATGDEFGFSVSVNGDVAVVGARGDDDNGGTSGSAYVYRRDGSSWGQEAKLIASDGAPSDEFGRAVSVTGDTAVVGARSHDEGGANSGAAYVYDVDCPPPCPWDCGTPDAQVSVVDFLALLASWGQAGVACDIDGEGVGVTDFLALLAHWGPCP